MSSRWTCGQGNIRGIENVVTLEADTAECVRLLRPDEDGAAERVVPAGCFRLTIDLDPMDRRRRDLVEIAGSRNAVDVHRDAHAAAGSRPRRNDRHSLPRVAPQHALQRGDAAILGERLMAILADDDAESTALAKQVRRDEWMP